MTELATLKPPTVRLWSRDFRYIAGCEPITTGPGDRPAQITVRVDMNSDLARAVTGSDFDEQQNLTVDLPEGRFCGTIRGWSTGRELRIDATDLTYLMAKCIIPPMLPIHEIPAQPSPTVIQPGEIVRLADRIATAVRDQTGKTNTYVGRAFDANGESRVAHMIIDGAVDFREVAYRMLTETEN